jgi:hypothetical protein
MIKHIAGIDNREWFARGLICGITDTNPDLFNDIDDYWHAYDETVDLNIWVRDGEILCTAYPVFNGIRDDSTFERVEWARVVEPHEST